jgi:hypothetical protein
VSDDLTSRAEQFGVILDDISIVSQGHEISNNANFLYIKFIFLIAWLLKNFPNAIYYSF